MGCRSSDAIWARTGTPPGQTRRHRARGVALMDAPHECKGGAPDCQRLGPRDASADVDEGVLAALSAIALGPDARGPRMPRPELARALELLGGTPVLVAEGRAVHVAVAAVGHREALPADHAVDAPAVGQGKGLAVLDLLGLRGEQLVAGPLARAL